MDISSISRCYNLNPISVLPEQLLVDPKNPRIVLDIDSDQEFTLGELTKQDVQDYILSVINKDAYHIADLIRGIKASGFIDKGDDMIVKRIPQSNKFLVIEGNRRTTAIKHLLNDKQSLRPTVRSTLASLRVKEFIYRPNGEFTEEAVIDILLGTIHITGHLGWGALEKAYYIYNSYLRELQKFTGDSEFEYILECSREVAAFFNLAVRGVRKQLIVYRVYQQLKEEGYDVAPDHFSLIEMAVVDQQLSAEYFELDRDRFHLSHKGLSRFSLLCIRENKPVNNPGEFRRFAKVFKCGTDYEVKLIESNEQSLDSVSARLKRRLEQREFLGQLEDVKAQLDSLEPAAFRGLRAEIALIVKIRHMVEDKLWRLAKATARSG